MTRERLRLRLVAPPDIWLATWSLEEPVWAVVSGRTAPSAMLAEVVTYAKEIPWRSDAPSRIEVGNAVLAINRERWVVNPDSRVVHHRTTACKGKAWFVPWTPEPGDRGCLICGLDAPVADKVEDT